MPDETCGCGFIGDPDNSKVDPTACKYPALKEQIAKIGTDCVNYITNGEEVNPQTDVEAIAAIREFWNVVREELQSAHQFSIRSLEQVERASKRIEERLAKCEQQKAKAHWSVIAFAAADQEAKGLRFALSALTEAGKKPQFDPEGVYEGLDTGSY